MTSQHRVHISLGVSDLDRSVAFYSRFLGHGPSKLEPGYANWRLDAPPLHLALVASDDNLGGASRRHYGIELLDHAELGGWQARLTAAGIAHQEEKGETCCYAVSDKIWVEDPDGQPWEVWYRLADAPSLGPTSPSPSTDKVAKQPTACCTPTCCA